MDTNGLSLYNVGTSLDLDALTGGGTQGKNNDSEGDDTDDGEEDEIQQRNAEVCSNIIVLNYNEHNILIYNNLKIKYFSLLCLAKRFANQCI